MASIFTTNTKQVNINGRHDITQIPKYPFSIYWEIGSQENTSPGTESEYGITDLTSGCRTEVLRPWSWPSARFKSRFLFQIMKSVMATDDIRKTHNVCSKFWNLFPFHCWFIRNEICNSNFDSISPDNFTEKQHEAPQNDPKLPHDSRTRDSRRINHHIIKVTTKG